VEWPVAQCSYFGRLGNEIGLFGLVSAVLGSRFLIHLCPNGIEKTKTGGLTNGDLGSPRKFTYVHHSFWFVIGIKFANDRLLYIPAFYGYRLHGSVRGCRRTVSISIP